MSIISLLLANTPAATGTNVRPTVTTYTTGSGTNATNSTTLSIPKPSTYDQGDLLVAVMIGGIGSKNVTWSLPTATSNLGFTLVGTGSNAAPSVAYAYMKATSSNFLPSAIIFTSNNGTALQGYLLVIKDADWVGPIPSGTPRVSYASNIIDNITSPSLTLTSDDHMVFRVIANAAEAITNIGTEPAPWTTVYGGKLDGYNYIAGGPSVRMPMLSAAAGTYGGKNYSVGDNTSGAKCICTFAVKKPGSTGGGGGGGGTGGSAPQFIRATDVVKYTSNVSVVAPTLANTSELQTGDLLVYMLLGSGGGNSFASVTPSSGVTSLGYLVNSPNIGTFYRFYDGTDQVTFTLGDSCKATCVTLVFRNAVVHAHPAAPSSTATTPALTTTVDNCTILRFWAGLGGGSPNAPSGTTQLVKDSNSSYCAHLITSDLQDAAGAVPTYTAGGGASVQATVLAIASTV